MRCADVAEVLGEYLDGTLDPGRVKLLEAHLRACPDCQAMLAEYKQTVQMCCSLDEEEVPQGFHADLLSRVAVSQDVSGEVGETPRRRRLTRQWWSYPTALSVYRGLAVAGLALILMVSGAVIYQSSPVQNLVSRGTGASVADTAGSYRAAEGQATGAAPSRFGLPMTASGYQTGNALVGVPSGAPASGAASTGGAPESQVTMSVTAGARTADVHGLSGGVASSGGASAPGPAGGGAGAADPKALTIAAANESSTKTAGSPAGEVQHKIVYSASLRLDAEDFNKTYTSIVSITEAAQGYVERSDYSTPGPDAGVSVSGAGSARKSILPPTPPPPGSPPEKITTMTLRVPSEFFASVLSKVEDLGSVKWRHVNSRDVTEDYLDVEGRLAAANVHEARLLDILGKAASVEEILKVENELEKVRSTVEVLTRQLRSLSNQVSYSTITVELHEARQNPFGPEGPQGLGGRIGGAFLRSVDGLVRLVVDLAIFLSAALPWLVLLAVVTLVARYLWKRHGPRRGTGTGAL